MEGQEIELAGRVEGLGEDEEGQLIDALTALIARHGLTPSQIRINGRRIVPPEQEA